MMLKTAVKEETLQYIGEVTEWDSLIRIGLSERVEEVKGNESSEKECQVMIGEKQLEQVDMIKYLEAMISDVCTYLDSHTHTSSLWPLALPCTASCQSQLMCVFVHVCVYVERGR